MEVFSGHMLCASPALGTFPTPPQEGLETSHSKCCWSCRLDMGVQRGGMACPLPHSKSGWGRGLSLSLGARVCAHQEGGRPRPGSCISSQRLHVGPSVLELDWANLICSLQEQSPGHQNPSPTSFRGQTPSRETPETLCPSRPLSGQEWPACAATRGGQDRQGGEGLCRCLPGPRHDPGPTSKGPDPRTSGRRASGLMEVAGVRILAQRGPCVLRDPGLISVSP